MPCACIDAAWSLFSRIASRPPCTLGCSVFTRPSIISGKPVSSDTSSTLSPASASALRVPPVETSSTPRSASARASSTSPLLSDTEMRAREMRRGWSVMMFRRLSQQARGVMPASGGASGKHCGFNNTKARPTNRRSCGILDCPLCAGMTAAERLRCLSPQRQLRLLAARAPRRRCGTPAAVYENVHCTRITLRARP